MHFNILYIIYIYNIFKNNQRDHVTLDGVKKIRRHKFDRAQLNFIVLLHFTLYLPKVPSTSI